MQTRQATKYPGVFYRIRQRIRGPGQERVYYIVFKKEGRGYEEKVGRRYADDMTPARAARIRAERIDGRRQSRKEIREQEKAREAAEVGRWTVDRLWQEYDVSNPTRACRSGDKSRHKKHIKPAFGDRELKDIIPLDVDRLRVKLSKTLKPQTVQHVLTQLARLNNFAKKKQLCEGLRFTIKHLRVHNLRTENLSTEQIANLLAAIDTDPHPAAGPMMKAALYTGMRRGELFKLKWQDVDFERGFIHIRDPKGGPDQTIPLNDMARALFANHPRTKSEYVFSGRYGGQRTQIDAPVNAIKKAAGLPEDFRPLHGLRHVFAATLASSGQVDLYTLQRLLAHKNFKTTQRYAHLRDDALRRASDVAGELFGKIANGENGKG